MTTTAQANCPVCDGAMTKADLPRFDIFSCVDCKEVAQLVDGSMKPIGTLLERHSLGDDRVMSAISHPHVSTVKSFIDIFENITRFLHMDLATASGGLRSTLAQVENRIDSALQCFTGLDLASDEAAKGLTALREAREMVSTMPPATRGVKGDEDVDAAISPPE